MTNQEILLTSSEKTEIKKKIKSTDLQLACAIIGNFYDHHSIMYFTAEQIHSFISNTHETTIEKISEILQCLCDGWLCGKKITINEDTKEEKIEYNWAIRTSPNGSIHFGKS